MNQYSCIIVDDETLAQELLISHCSKIPELDIVSVCNNAIRAKSEIEKYQPDILFLDIQMPNLTGLELLHMLKRRPATILTTAYSEYAIEGFELDVMDYILKPIEFDRFFKAVSKSMEWINRGKITIPTELSPPVMPVETPETYFFVKSDHKMIKVVFSDILYIEALQKYVRIHTTKQRIITLMSMSSLETTLPQHQFIRIHRSYTVNLEKIDSIEGNMVRIGQHQVPISKGQKEVFLEWVNRNKSNL